MNCPICDSKMTIKSAFLTDSGAKETFCHNDCYTIKEWRVRTDYYFMRKSLVTVFRTDNLNEKNIEIQDVISYWKENDRYLIEILANN